MVGDHHAVEPLRDALSEDKPDDRADVVDHEREPIEPRLIDEALKVVGVAPQQIVKVARLRAAAEARQVGSDPTRALEERSPDSEAHRVAVQVEDPETCGRLAFEPDHA